MQRDPVPEGRSKLLSVPQIFVVETEPRHEQATARRMPRPLQKRQVLLLKVRVRWDRFNRPAGTGYFPHDSRHFVPGYDRAVPPGQNHSPSKRLAIILALMG